MGDYFFVDMTALYTNWGRMHSDAQFAGFSSVKFLFLLRARQNKQVSFALACSSVPAHVEMMGFLGIGKVRCKRVSESLLTLATSEAITRQRQQPYGRCSKLINKECSL